MNIRKEVDPRFKEILEYMLEVYTKKNHDYGGAFTKGFKEFGLVSAVIRISDKTSRLTQLTKLKVENESPKVDESVEDTLLDLANYAVMTLKELGYNPYKLDSDADVFFTEDSPYYINSKIKEVPNKDNVE